MANSKQILEAAREAKAHEGVVAQERLVASLRSKLSASEYKNKALLTELEMSERRNEFVREIAAGERNTRFEKLAKQPGGESTAIVVLTDWHTEERVDPDTIDGLNEFNLEIAAARIERTFQKIPELIEKFSKFTTMPQLVLALLGDLITGFIHPELKESNYLSPTEASLFVQDRLCAGIDFLLKQKCVKTILIPTCHGNHGRTTEKPRTSTAYKNSYEWLLYNQMAKLYRNEPRVEWKIAKGIHNWVDVQKHGVRFHHGDNIKYQGGVGGITIPVNKKIAQWNKARTASLDIFGHYHQFFNHWPRWISCGCLIGYNAYAQSIGAEPQEPTQPFIVMSKEHGLVMAEPIFCQ